MKKIIITSVALVCAINANAQVGTVTSRTIKTTTTTREVEVEFNKYNRISLSYAAYKHNLGGADDHLEAALEHYYYNNDHDGDVEDAWPGFIAEYVHGWRLMKSQPLFLEGGVALHFNIKDLHYIHFAAAVPINVTYRYTANNGFYVAPLIGLNLSSNAEDDLLEGLWVNGRRSTFKFFQLGYNAGANLGYKRLNIGIGYRGDFMPSLTTEDYGNIKTGTFHIGLGVNF